MKRVCVNKTSDILPPPLKKKNHEGQMSQSPLGDWNGLFGVRNTHTVAFELVPLILTNQKLSNSTVIYACFKKKIRREREQNSFAAGSRRMGGTTEGRKRRKEIKRYTNPRIRIIICVSPKRNEMVPPFRKPVVLKRHLQLPDTQ